MKKRLMGMVLAGALALGLAGTAAAERPIRIIVGGEVLETDVAPIYG